MFTFDVVLYHLGIIDQMGISPVEHIHHKLIANESCEVEQDLADWATVHVHRYQNSSLTKPTGVDAWYDFHIFMLQWRYGLQAQCKRSSTNGMTAEVKAQSMYGAIISCMPEVQ